MKKVCVVSMVVAILSMIGGCGQTGSGTSNVNETESNNSTNNTSLAYSFFMRKDGEFSDAPSQEIGLCHFTINASMVMIGRVVAVDGPIPLSSCVPGDPQYRGMYSKVTLEKVHDVHESASYSVQTVVLLHEIFSGPLLVDDELLVSLRASQSGDWFVINYLFANQSGDPSSYQGRVADEHDTLVLPDNLVSLSSGLAATFADRAGQCPELAQDELDSAGFDQIAYTPNTPPPCD